MGNIEARQRLEVLLHCINSATINSGKSIATVSLAWNVDKTKSKEFANLTYLSILEGHIIKG